METYKTYDDIPSDVFADKIKDLAAANIETTLMLPGIYEIIAEEYNNSALDILCPDGSGETPA